MGRLWKIVQDHIDAQPYGASHRSVAAKLGISPTALGNWRTLRKLPAPENLHALANLTGTPYLRVLDAALEDAGYHVKAGEGNVRAPSMNDAEGTSATDEQDIGSGGGEGDGPPPPSDIESILAPGKQGMPGAPGSKGKRAPRGRGARRT